jgi:hypothetical protein
MLHVDDDGLLHKHGWSPPLCQQAYGHDFDMDTEDNFNEYMGINIDDMAPRQCPERTDPKDIEKLPKWKNDTQTGSLLIKLLLDLILMVNLMIKPNGIMLQLWICCCILPTIPGQIFALLYLARFNKYPKKSHASAVQMIL